MSDLIDALLSLARLSRGDLLIERVDLSVLAQSIVADLRRADPDRRVEVGIEAGLCAQGDQRLLQVVLENLLSNAWKFTRRKDRARIELGSAQQDGQPVFFVRDNGAGFDMAYADKLFGAFQRLHTDDEFEGDGIGLATVYRIICRHGGRIWAEGKVDEGATFYFMVSNRGAGHG
jgi:light-regulated signal transduction histidine kinase (bacteriophytochrome)